uniref:Uncharacterized protein n=1 Tax=Acrobeloides nanus TaxID=290746 RepID=A0A914E808_9BILA
MLASKTKFAFNLVQRSLLIRFQHSGALGSETPRFYPKNPSLSLKKDAGSKLSFEQEKAKFIVGMMDNIEQIEEKVYELVETVKRPYDLEEKSAEEYITIYDYEELAREAVAIYIVEKPAEEAVETVQIVREQIEEIEERIDQFFDQVNECAKELDSFDQKWLKNRPEVDRVIDGMSEKAEQIVLKVDEIEELVNEAVETVQYATKKLIDDTKGEELKEEDHKQ